MSGTLNAERDSRPSKAPPSPAGTADLAGSGVEMRLDPAHRHHSAVDESARGIVPLDPAAPSGAEAGAPDSYGASSESDGPLAESVDNDQAGPATGKPGYDKLLLQAGQIAEHLKHQCAELDRREFRLHEQLTLLDQERRNVRMWVANFDIEVEEREAALADREAACAERTAACLKLEQELQELHQALLRERYALTAEQEQLQQTRDSDQQALEVARAEQLRELEQHRADMQADRERLQAEFKQERSLLENRLRFQQDHLQKSRQEFETAQTAFRTEQQVAWTRLDETQVQIRLRSRQLDRIRDLWQERERSVERERLMLFKSRRALEEGHRSDTANLRNEQAAWEQEREAQRADLRRQQDMLALHAENLESRRLRLDRLRSELEETNRATLELRLSVEEAYAQLAQASGAELAKERVDEARRILAEHYRYTRDSITQQRHDLDQLQSRVQQQRVELQTERQSLTAWVTEREEQMRERERKLAEERAACEVHQQARDAAREQWTNERLEAESIIRDLLQQLTDRELAPSRVLGDRENVSQ